MQTISRLQLVVELGNLYADLQINPFVLKKDGKIIYDLDESYVDFTCCNENHTLTMTPRQMLNLRKTNGIIPCPICCEEYKRNKGIVGGVNNDILPGEDIVKDNLIMRKYMLTDDPAENNKKIAKLTAEQNKEKIKHESQSVVIKKDKRTGPQRTKQDGETNDFIPSQPTFIDGEETAISDYDSIIQQSDDTDQIAPSIPYDEYIKMNQTNNQIELAGDTRSENVKTEDNNILSIVKPVQNEIKPSNNLLDGEEDFIN